MASPCEVLIDTDDRRVTGEPAFGQATGEPVARTARIGLFGLLVALTR